MNKQKHKTEFGGMVEYVSGSAVNQDYLISSFDPSEPDLQRPGPGICISGNGIYYCHATSTIPVLGAIVYTASPEGDKRGPWPALLLVTHLHGRRQEDSGLWMQGTVLRVDT